MSASRDVASPAMITGLFDGPVPSHVPPGLVRTFDYITDQSFVAEPYAGCTALMADAPRIFYSPGFAGGWIITRFEDVRAVLQDAETFSSKGIANVVPREDGQSFSLIPLELDAPEHGKYRVMLNPIFAPREIDRLEADIRRVSTNLIDAFVDKGSCDFVADFARPLPTAIFVRMMGLPEDRTAQFIKWTEQIIHSHNPQLQKEAADGVLGLLMSLFAERRRVPTDDLIGKLVRLEIDGKPISDNDMCGFGFLLFIAGLDTVTSSLSNIFRYLAEMPELQSRLAKDPSLIPNAVEEFMRAFSSVNTGRVVARDIEFQGVQMKAGDKVLCFMSAANRDAGEFEQPEQVDIEREASRHLAFSSGPHRCIGSHLARREMRIALELFLARIPQYSLVSLDQSPRYGGGVWGHYALPLRW